MNNKEIAAVIDKIQSITEDFYLGNPEKLISCINKNIVYIGENDEDFCIGKSKTVEKLNKKIGINKNCRLKNQKFACNLQSKNMLVVTGKYTVICSDSEKIHAKNHRVSYIWVMGNGEGSLVHLHVSNPVVLDGFSERIISYNKNTELSNRIVLKDIEGNRHFISEDEIIYVEADNMNSSVCCRNEKFNVRLTLKEMSAMLTENFIRLHKSYSVNKEYVTGISRYFVQLTNGEAIPVSKEKYMDLRGIFSEKNI